ncbi:MAG: MBL fold metallo-hydrolase [Patescibacteria group bacterium]
MSDVGFTAYSSFNPSRYELRFGTFRVAVDFGAGFGKDTEIAMLQPQPDAIVITHGHRDHIGMVPQAMQRWPRVPVYATFETTELGKWIWGDELKIARQEHRDLPFSESDIDRAVRRIRRLLVGPSIQLTPDLTMTPFHAGHILGAVGLVFTYRGENFVVTGDISMHSHGFIEGAKLPDLQSCRALVRESTYVGQRLTQDRDVIAIEFILAVKDVLERGGTVVVPTLSIDRMPEVYALLHESEIDLQWPVWVVGGRVPTQIYLDFAQSAHVIRTMQHFENRQHQEDTLKSHAPMVVLASSGMMMPCTPSYAWGASVLQDANSAIFFVNWQDPRQPGGIILHGSPGDELELPDGRYKRLCEVERFDFSSHAKENEMEEIERALNPCQIIHVHGEEDRIRGFIEGNKGIGPERHQAFDGQEIAL